MTFEHINLSPEVRRAPPQLLMRLLQTSTPPSVPSLSKILKNLRFYKVFGGLAFKNLRFYKVFGALGFKKLSFYKVFGCLGLKKLRFYKVFGGPWLGTPTPPPTLACPSALSFEKDSLSF